MSKKEKEKDKKKKKEKDNPDKIKKADKCKSSCCEKYKKGEKKRCGNCPMFDLKKKAS
jgi:ferric iron reductase protein FhuF